MTPGMTEVPSKREFALSLLEECPSVFVHLDARREGVVVPSQFQKQAQLILQVGYRMPVPIPDLEVDEAGIRCTLSFGGRARFCRMPWSAVFALIGENRRALVWPQDVPPEVVAQQNARRAPAGSHLRAVDGGAGKQEEGQLAPAGTAAAEGASTEEREPAGAEPTAVVAEAASDSSADEGARSEGVEALRVADAEPEGGAPDAPAPPVAPGRARLKAVGRLPSAGADESASQPEAGAPGAEDAGLPDATSSQPLGRPASSKRPPYLRLVK